MKKILQLILSLILGLILISLFTYLFLEKKITFNMEPPKPTFSHTGGIRFE